MYNETGCHGFQEMEFTKWLRVQLRITVHSLQKEFLGLMDVPSFHGMLDEESEKMENCC